MGAIGTVRGIYPPVGRWIDSVFAIAWVMGAGDPTSGTVSLHEVIKGFGTLLRSGWKPLRNVVIASWDAEEVICIFLLVVSDADDLRSMVLLAVQSFQRTLQSGSLTALSHTSTSVCAYYNFPAENLIYVSIDVSVMGSQWNAAASPSLAHLIHQVALEIPHPTEPGRTLWDARTDVGPYAGNADVEAIAVYAEKQQTQSSSTGIYPLGSGSDFTVFLQRLGVSAS